MNCPLFFIADLMRTHFALFVCAMLTFLIGVFSGTIGCWKLSKRALLVAGIVLFVGGRTLKPLFHQAYIGRIGTSNAFFFLYIYLSLKNVFNFFILSMNMKQNKIHIEYR